MKRILKIAALALVMVLGSSLRNTASAQYSGYNENRDVSYQNFYDELSPYGQWVDYPGQGYVWVPDAGDNFRPYSTNGHWVWTDNYEWMWVSDYDWGWAPFHYGRWEEDDYYGWYWVPGYEWSPAWVAWRDGGDYYGWAPLRPGINININYNIGGYNPPNNYWCFAPRRYITSPRIYDYCVDRRQNITIINYTTIITNNYRYGNNYGFGSGPRRYDAERYCGRINPVRYRETYSPGRSTFRNNEVSIYRPAVRHDNDRSIAPRQFERYDRSSNSGFRRNDNNGQRNDNNGVRGNNSGIDRRNENSRVERRNDNVRQPQNNDGNTTNPAERRRFERNDNNSNEQPNPNGDRRFGRPTETPGRTSDPVNNNGNNDNRRFERRDNNYGNQNAPVRQPETRRQEEPVRQPQQQVERRFEQRSPQQVERRQEQPQHQPQQMERRQEPRQDQPFRQPQQQSERRQPSQQEQPQRQFERRESSSSQQGGGDDKGKGNGRSKRF